MGSEDLLLHNQQPLSQLLWGSDLLKQEFLKWFSPILKWRWWFRVQKGYELFEPIAGKILSELIIFLELFAKKKLVCWLVHETGKHVIGLVDWRFVPLTQFNCNMQDSNSACGHPEISGLAQAIFIAERLIWNRFYTRWFGLLNAIIGFDTDIWWLAENWIYNKPAVINKQEIIAWNIVTYIQELVEKLREKSIQEEEISA